MLTGSQLFSNLSVAIDASQAVITLASTAGLVIAPGNHTYFTLDDGVAQEIVRASAVSGLTITVLRGQLGTTARAFVSGVCLKPYNGYETVCELIAQGGCSGVGSATCTPVSSGGSFFPEAVIGADWQAAATYSNAQIITVPVKPAWVTVVVAAGMVTMGGVPPVGTTDFKLVVIANGCNNSSVVTDRIVRICQQIGVAP
jgi:hypothetical protein